MPVYIPQAKAWGFDGGVIKSVNCYLLLENVKSEIVNRQKTVSTDNLNFHLSKDYSTLLFKYKYTLYPIRFQQFCVTAAEQFSFPDFDLIYPDPVGAVS